MKKQLIAAVMTSMFGIAALTSTSFAGTGNGAPTGPHYNLNIIGVPQDKSANMNQGSGNVIFVDLGTKNGKPVTADILLSQSTDGTFAVLDKNGTDGQASFELPAPGTYTIWARAVGTPGGSSNMTTCAIDPLDPTVTICSTTSQVFVRGTGTSKFTNVTTPLTTITLSATDQALSGCTQSTVSLFDACLQGYFWQYDNNGLKNLQVRFYPSV